MTEERTPLQDIERRALTGNRAAVIQVISALRRYREVSRGVIDRWFNDGETDAAIMDAFSDAVEEIENTEGGV